MTIDDSLMTRPESASAGPAPGWRGHAVGLLFLGIGLAALGLSLGEGLTEDGGLGSGVWPLILSAIVITCSVAYLSMPRLRTVEPASDREWIRVGTGVGLLVAFVVLFATVGVVSACLVAGTLWFRFVSGERTVTSLALAGGATVTIVVVFVVLLDLPLPVEFVR